MLLAGLFLAALMLVPMMRNRVTASVTLLEAFGVNVPRPFVSEPRLVDGEVGGVAGRLYGSGDSPAVLLVPGATPAGVTDSRVNAVARALARAGRTVFIPELDLYREQFTEADLERIVDAVAALAEDSQRPVTVAGFSYGGSLALVAAADPRMEGRLSRVATLGAYFDLVGVVQAVTTGSSAVDDRLIPWEGHPLAEEVLTTRTVAFLPEEDQEPVLAALAGEADPGVLSPGARSLYELLVNEDPLRTPELAEELPVELRALIERFSPSQVADRIRVPVLAMHSTDDPLVPYAELVRLEAEMPAAGTMTVELFRHVDLEARSLGDWLALIPDLWRVWSFTTWLLAG